MRLGVIDFSEKHANIGTVVWATVHTLFHNLTKSAQFAMAFSTIDSDQWGSLPQQEEDKDDEDGNDNDNGNNNND